MKSRKGKKWLSAFLAACLMLGTVGCGGTPATTSGSGSSATGSGSTGGDDLVRGGVGDGKYKESPALHELVEKGELPPIEERLPEEPAVVEVDEIGVYGGT
jgi:peptide/nickel transport system substrate-binding protein